MDDKLKELIAYNFFPTGKDFEGNKLYNCSLSHVEAVQAYISNAELDLEYIEKVLIDELEAVRGKKPVLFFSGGIDSTYLGILLNRLGIDYDLFNIAYEDYDETASAIMIANQVLNKHVELMYISQDQLLSDLPKIMKYGFIGERGSVLLTYYLMQTKHKCIIAGDSADAIFMPSFEKEHIAFETNVFKYSALTNKEFDQLDIDVTTLCHHNAKEFLLFFDILYEVPYYYRAKYELFNKSKEIVLPYQNTKLLKYALACKDLHLKTHKFYLKELVKKHTTYDFKKKAFKVNRSNFKKIIDSYYINSYEDELSFLTNPKSIEKMKLQIALYNAWLKI